MIESDVENNEEVLSSDPELHVEQSPPRGVTTRRGRRQQTRSTSSMTLRPRSAVTRNLRSESAFDQDGEDGGETVLYRSKSVGLKKKVDGADESDGDEGRISRKRKTPANFKMQSDGEDEGGKEKKPATKKSAPAPQKRRGKQKKNGEVPDTIAEEEGEQNAENEPKPKTQPKKKGAKKAPKEPAKKKTPEKRRRRIKEIEELEVDTRVAMKEELERQKRIAERQKIYNPTQLAASVPPTETTDNVVILEQNDQVTLQVEPEIARKLKKHQIDAVQFIWTACCESLERLRNPDYPGSGCIVAHCMGLGKTLSVIAFLHTMIMNREITGIKTCLVLAPLNTVLNWIAEFLRWVPQDKALNVYEISSVKETKERAFDVEAWYQNGGIMIMGYDIYRKLAQTKPRNRWAKANIFPTALVNPGPDFVVCDEGHILKSENSVISKVLNQIRTRRRIVLTGTPLQNNLFEYHCMVSFIKPHFLGSKAEFANMFATPIKNGETADATPADVMLMKKRTSVLYRLLAPCVHRRGYEHLSSVLPPKLEYVLLLRLTPVQCQLYAKYLAEIVGVSPALENILTEDDAHYIRRRLFTDYHALQYICAHPCLLFEQREQQIQREVRREIKRELEAMSVDEDELEMQLDDETSEEEESDDDVFFEGAAGSSSRASEGRSESQLVSRASGCVESRGESRPSRMGGIATRASSRRTDSAVVLDEMAGGQMAVEEEEVEKPWFYPIITEEMAVKAEISSKFMVMLHLIRSFEAIGDKTLVFSQSLIFLNLFELALAEESKRREEAAANGGDPALIELIPTFEKNKDYFRIDGQVSAPMRRDAINRFNNTEDLRARLLLISTKAGGIGVNLVGANRVLLTDASWNPSQDIQAIFRAYRYGQKKPVGVYRLIAAGTMEEKIYDRQVMKQSLSQRVIDEQQIARHFSTRDLLNLYRFDAKESQIPELPNLDSSLVSNSSEPPCDLATLAARFAVPKDRVLAEMLRKVPHWFSSYHDHDSLLVHQVHEQLNEGERLAAWREYEIAQKKNVTVDSNDALTTHHQLSWALRRDLGLEQHESDLRAVHELDELFGTIRPNVREFVDKYLPYYEKAAAEAEERKRKELETPTLKQEPQTGTAFSGHQNPFADKMMSQPKLPFASVSGAAGPAFQYRRRRNQARSRREPPMDMKRLMEEVERSFGTQAAAAALAANRQDNYGPRYGESTSSSSDGSPIKMYPQQPEQSTEIRDYHRYGRDTASDSDSRSETMSYREAPSMVREEVIEDLPEIEK